MSSSCELEEVKISSFHQTASSHPAVVSAYLHSSFFSRSEIELSVDHGWSGA